MVAVIGGPDSNGCTAAGFCNSGRGGMRVVEAQVSRHIFLMQPLTY
jgi:hypothetical protein